MGLTLTQAIFLIFTTAVFTQRMVQGLFNGISFTAGASRDFVFFTTGIQNYRKCLNLCASVYICKAVNYFPGTGTCQLARDTSIPTPTNNAMYMEFTKLPSQVPNEICRARPCRTEDFCVMTTFGKGYICLNYKNAIPCDNPEPLLGMTTHTVLYTIAGAIAEYACAEGYLYGGGTGETHCTHTNWTQPSLNCQIVDCITLTPQPNMAGSVSTTTYGATATYSCVVGHTGTGSGASTCQADGTWSVPALTCTAVGCGSPTIIPHMTSTSTGTVYGDTATYTCEAGYTGSGSGTSTCQAGGTWSAPALTCIIVNCGILTSQPNMAGSASTTTYGATAAYSCVVGYTGTGSGTSTCQVDGTWSVPALACTAVGCGSPTIIPHMTSTSTGTLYGDTATYTCEVGYTGSGSETSTCQAGGTWTAPALTCIIVDCGILTSQPKMAGSASTTTYGATATYNCVVGYTGTGSGTSTCQVDGAWSVPALACTAVGCGSPTVIPHMTSTSTGTVYGDTATYTCEVGYTGSGSGTSTCQAGGTWTAPALTCIIVDCSTLTPQPKMAGSASTTTYGATGSYSCVVGYTGTGSGISTCQADGTWSVPTLTCTVVDCGILTSQPKMAGSASTTTYGATATYSCVVGHTGAGSRTSTCQADGTWGVPALTCTAADCGNPTVLPHMTSTSTGTVFSSTATYTCEAGYAGSGSGTSTCQADGLWSSPALSCHVVDCGAPVDVGQVVPVLFTTTTYQSEVAFACGLGQEPSSGNNKARCLSDGTWGIPTVQCTAMSNVVAQDTSTGTSAVFVCESRTSAPSAINDDAETAASCHVGEVLTGCTSKLQYGEPYKDGEQIRQVSGYAVCTAINSYQATGPTVAYSRCCSMKGLKCEYLRMPLSDTADNSQTTRTCKEGYWPTGCTAAHWWGQIDGVYLTNDGCIAQNRGTNQGVFGFTICCTAPNLKCVNVESPFSGRNYGDYASVSCPDGHTMLGCMGYSPDAGLQGAYITDQSGTIVCVVVNGKWKSSSETPPKAFASCCRIE